MKKLLSKENDLEDEKFVGVGIRTKCYPTVEQRPRRQGGGDLRPSIAYFVHIMEHGASESVKWLGVTVKP